VVGELLPLECEQGQVQAPAQLPPNGNLFCVRSCVVCTHNFGVHIQLLCTYSKTRFNCPSKAGVAAACPADLLILKNIWKSVCVRSCVVCTYSFSKTRLNCPPQGGSGGCLSCRPPHIEVTRRVTTKETNLCDKICAEVQNDESSAQCFKSSNSSIILLRAWRTLAVASLCVSVAFRCVMF